MALNASRQTGMNGPLPITYLEMQAWLSLTGEPVTKQQIGILRAMDEACLLAHRDVLAEQEAERKARAEREKLAKALLGR